MKKSLGPLVILNRSVLLSFVVILSFAFSATVSWRIEAQDRSGDDPRSERKGKDEVNVQLEPPAQYIERTVSPETTGTESEPNGTVATADPMPAFDPHSIMTGAINPGADEDFYSFSAPANSRVWIYVDTGGAQNAGANSRDSVVDLIGTDGTTVLETDDDDGTGNGGDGIIEPQGTSASAIAGSPLTTGGTYFIRVRPFFLPTAVINPYRLFVRVTSGAGTAEVEPNNTAATANAGGLTTGAITTPGDVDYYSITAEAGSVLFINADANPERDASDTDLVVELRSPADAVLLTIDSSFTSPTHPSPWAEAASFNITATGTYFVRVRHSDAAAGTGTYHLMLARNQLAAGSGCAATGAVTAANNTPVAISDVGTPVVTSTINIAGAGPVLHSMRVTTNIVHTFSSDLDITLTSPAGTHVTLTTDNGGGNDNVFNGTQWYDTANPFGTAPYTSNNGLAQDHLYINNVVATPLVPEEGFDAFRGENPNGTWTLTVSDDTNQDGGSLNGWSISVSTSSALPAVNPVAVFTASPGITIPTTAPPNVFTSTINVAGLTGPVDDVDVVLNIQHTFPSDLDITLQAPSGKSVTITTDNGGTADNAFAGSLFDTDADPDGVAPYVTNANHVGDHPYVIGALATPLTLEESAAAFRGEQPNGVWTMTVSDDLNLDGGTWVSWELRIQTNTCPLPSAAGVDVSGRVMTAEGNGLVNAKVTLTDQGGNILQTVVTGKEGAYRLTGVEVGRTYIISVGSRRYVFEPRVIQIFDSIAEADFTALR